MEQISSKWLASYLGGITGVFGSFVVFCADYHHWDWYLISFLWWVIACRLIMQTVGLHKYWAHNSFDTGPIREWILTWGCILCGTGSPYNWAVHHRHHHKHTDTDKDIHSPNTNTFTQSFFITWMFKPDKWWRDKKISLKHKDLLSNKKVMHIHKYYHHYWFALIIATLIIDWRITLFFVLQPVGLNMLMSGINNHLSHTDIVPKSYRNYESKDNSHNLPGWTNLLLLGEGYHHNHHYAPWKYDNADKPGEWDLSGWVIRTFFDIHRGKLGSDYKRY